MRPDIWSQLRLRRSSMARLARSSHRQFVSRPPRFFSALPYCQDHDTARRPERSDRAPGRQENNSPAELSLLVLAALVLAAVKPPQLLRQAAASRALQPLIDLFLRPSASFS